uniref:Uncharacterized protein n=1 Tax=Sciurus vulgaris TaxID=55149 RepID=A0A8D2DQY8_SCIVU
MLSQAFYISATGSCDMGNHCFSQISSLMSFDSHSFPPSMPAPAALTPLTDQSSLELMVLGGE